MSNIEKINSEIVDFIGFLHKSGNIKPFLKDIYLITMEVAGLSYINDIDEIFPQLKKGDKLDLFRENNNEYDELAIVIKHSGRKIGYVPRKDNTILANLMDAGKELYGVIEVTAEENVYSRFPFKVVKFKVYLKE